MTEWLLSAFGAYMALGAIVAWWQGRFSFWAWFNQVWLAIDQLGNVLGVPFNSGSWADETMSSRIYRAHRDGKLAGRILLPIVDWVFGLWQPPEHCKRAFESERLGLQNTPEARTRT